MAKLQIGLVLATGAALLVGCGPGGETFSTADVCVARGADPTVVTRLFSEFAEARGMDVFDRSEETFDETSSLFADDPDPKLLPATLNLRIEDKDGLGLVVGNLGLSKRQFAVAFHRQAAGTASDHLVSDSVRAMEARGWKVSLRPGDHSVMRDDDCT